MTFATKYPEKKRPTSIPEVLEATLFGHRVLVASFTESGHPVNHRVVVNDQNELIVVHSRTTESRPFTDADCVYTYLR